MPILADIRQLSPEFASLAEVVASPGREIRVMEPDASDHLFVATPIREEQAHLGTLVQIYSKQVLRSRFQKSAGQAALIALLVIVLLLPIGWYWGQRTAVPLVRLTERMEELGRRLPDDLAPELYDSVRPSVSAIRVRTPNKSKRSSAQRAQRRIMGA